MANEDVYTASGSLNHAYQNGSGSDTGTAWIGHHDTWGNEDGAIRFTGIQVGQGVSVNYAQLRVYIGAKAGSEVFGIFRGIDEDNTADFSSNPFSRSETTANTTSSTTQGVGDYWSVSVTSIVNEIFARGGWSSNNALGFIIRNNGTTGTNDLATVGSSQLVIRVSPEPDFTPTPVSIAVPTFPQATHFGMKFSRPGINVLEAAETDLFFTTRKKSFKIVLEGQVSCTANVEKTIAHGLSYAPAVLAYAKGSTKRFKLIREFDGATDPIGGGVQGYVGADTTNIRILVNATTTVYYYCFIDPLT